MFYLHWLFCVFNIVKQNMPLVFFFKIFVVFYPLSRTICYYLRNLTSRPRRYKVVCEISHGPYLDGFMEGVAANTASAWLLDVGAYMAAPNPAFEKFGI